MRAPIMISADFASQALDRLMDVLNDDSVIVRLSALETMQDMAVFRHLRVQEIHMHMFLSTLVGTNSLVRAAARKVLRLMKLSNLATFKLSFDSLIQCLDMYPLDEPDVLSAIFHIGQNHGTYSTKILKEVFQEVEPSFDGKLDFDSAKTAARLVLAISAPLCNAKQQKSCSIPPVVFSYTVTMLGRISRGLSDVMDQNALLDYLSCCSRSAVVPPSESVTDKDLPTIEVGSPSILCSPTTSPMEMDLPGESHDASEILSLGLVEDETTSSHENDQLDDEASTVKFILAKMGKIWPLIKLGCITEVLKTLRSWKQELATFSTGPLQSPDVLTFGVEYLRSVKQLAKAWLHLMGSRSFFCPEMGELGIVLENLDRSLGLMRYRFIGLTQEEESHVLELILMAYTLRLYNFDFGLQSIMKKMHSVMSRVNFLQKDGSIGPSNFVLELKKLLHETDGDPMNMFVYPELLELFSLNEFPFCGKFKHVKAEMDTGENDWVKTLPFVPGLPVGIPLKITLHNIPSDARLWLRMTLAKNSTQYVFLDLKQYEGSEKMREFMFSAPFYRTPRAHSITVRVSIGMECLDEDSESQNRFPGPKHDLVYLCKEKNVYLSVVGKNLSPG